MFKSFSFTAVLLSYVSYVALILNLEIVFRPLCGHILSLIIFFTYFPKRTLMPSFLTSFFPFRSSGVFFELEWARFLLVCLSPFLLVLPALIKLSLVVGNVVNASSKTLVVRK